MITAAVAFIAVVLLVLTLQDAFKVMLCSRRVTGGSGGICRPSFTFPHLALSRERQAAEQAWLAPDLPPQKWTPGYAAFASACCGVM
jgi:hypothetical protein